MSKKILEGSRAVAEIVNLCKPDVVSAYPITPQTHIVEDLAQFKADGKADFEYVRAESEFAAASIVLGASATGSRAYTATCSQGLLLMIEVLYNIAGMRLPIVLTCANRAVSAPINIWNDHQDAMSVRDAGWIMLFAENVQEAVDMHVMAFKIAETAKLPVMVNMDGFILTHTYEPVEIPSAAMVNKFVGKYKPLNGQYLDVKNPCTLGAFASPADYQGIREELQDDLIKAGSVIKNICVEYYIQFQISNFKFQKKSKYQISNIKCDGNGLVEYTGVKNAEVVIVAMGSVVGTIRHSVQEMCSLGKKKGTAGGSIVPEFEERKFGAVEPTCNIDLQIGSTALSLVPRAKDYGATGGIAGILKIKTFRPFPNEEIRKVLKNAKYVAVLEKAISLGGDGILAGEIKQALYGTGIKVKSYIGGLGGRDITREMVKFIIKDVRGKGDKAQFI